MAFLLDTLLKNAVLLLPDGTVCKDAEVGIRGGEIVSIADKGKSGETADTVDCGGNLLTPGFYNAHAHSPMTILRGYGENLPLMRWLTERIFPAEDKLTAAVTSRAKQTETVRREAEREKMYADLLRAVSHDIRTPLTGIVGATNVLLEQDGELTQEQRQQLLRSTNEDAQWLIRIVENLLSITRIHNSEEARVKKAPEAAEEVIGSAVAKTQKHYPDVEVHVSVPHELMMVPMDPLLIEQVLVNLMENAVIHGGTSRIDVTLSQQGGNAVFTVADNGRGIPLHLLNKLFDGAARSDRSSDGKRSMGIGLSVCRTVVLAHGGTIRGENKKDGGACFTVTLPMKGDDDED